MKMKVIMKPPLQHYQEKPPTHIPLPKVDVEGMFLSIMFHLKDEDMEKIKVLIEDKKEC